MKSPKIKKILVKIANQSIKCMETVSSYANNEFKSRQINTTTYPIDNNTFVYPQPDINRAKIREKQIEALAKLIDEPIIAVVDCITEEGEKDTVFITRSGSPVVKGFKIADRNSPLGRLAALDAGDEGTFEFGGTDHDLLVDTTTRLAPQHTQEGWDAHNSELHTRKDGRFTIKSLREALLPHEQVDVVEDLDKPWEDEDEVNIELGIRRAVRDKFSLPERLFLDPIQDEIFRMPIDSQCYLYGPPGTGKTTTLIRRLGQKTNEQALAASNENFSLIRQVEIETRRPHEESWILFSPKELLRQYVKEAFAKEGVPASNDRIKTWEDYRHELARDTFKFLRTGADKGPFIEKSTENYLKLEIENDSKWYVEFRTYLDNSNSMEMKSNAELLSRSDSPDLTEIGGKLTNALSAIEPRRDFYIHALRIVKPFVQSIRTAIKFREDGIDGILTKTRNVLTRKHPDFPENLREEIERQLATVSIEFEDEEDIDAVLDDDDQALEFQATRRVTKKQALAHLKRAWKTLARTKTTRRQISTNSPDGLLLQWLGKARIPSEDDIAKLSILLMEQGRLRKFLNLERLTLYNIAIKYKNFRKEMAKEERWYKSTPKKPSHIHMRELDLLVLARLQIGNQILKSYRTPESPELPTAGLLRQNLNEHRAQVLVDEASDFSRVQLACMYEIAHPLLGSFFMCGDINQRLTSWGLKSNDAIEWIKPGIQRKKITVSYRQSRILVDLAAEIALIGGSQPTDIALPDRVNIDGVPPVWGKALKSSTQIAKWLTQRVREIEKRDKGLGSIAVLVNDEADVEQLASALTSHLEAINLKAVACKDGNVMGLDRDIRVFNIEHIKGLEFETVFFINIDQTIKNHPDLFPKYLYVGATRAATYLGITFSEKVSPQLSQLKSHFQENWSIGV